MLKSHKYANQCSVPINVFHGLIYTLIWWWFLLLTGATFLNLGYWIFRILFRPGQVTFMKFLLAALGHVPGDVSNACVLASFCSTYLDGDGFLSLKLLQETAGDVMTAKVLTGILENYKTNNINTSLNTNEHINLINDESNV